jgi:predicted nucleic acid-binding protein
MSDVVIYDTSILVDVLRTARQLKQVESVSGLLRTSAVVLAELRRGATKPPERKFLRALSERYPVLTPTKSNWLESGQLLEAIRADRGFAPEKLRDLHFDVLIALSARSHGARLITSNRRDFELIHRYRKFKLEVW